ncbi:hypothetical protein QWZ16_16955 [Vibrio ostreicida]|uniref:Uncharacterized protein n=2 Tax=Vibrio ostreicida TaxID=526588 RepID=A0ABT8BXB6_9VIBR|nr:hypothetical protein [Vibrio ostreicida]MDN3611293.1 hypothetical protein [Vibrio ostreicida]
MQSVDYPIHSIIKQPSSTMEFEDLAKLLCRELTLESKSGHTFNWNYRGDNKIAIKPQGFDTNALTLRQTTSDLVIEVTDSGTNDYLYKETSITKATAIGLKALSNKIK